MKSKGTVFAVGLVLALGIAFAAGWHFNHGSASAAPNPYYGGIASDCKAAVNEQCLTQDQIKLYQESVDWQKKVSDDLTSPVQTAPRKVTLSIQQEQAIAVGEQNLLFQQAPRDPLGRQYLLNPSEKKWVMMALPNQTPDAAKKDAAKPPAKK